VRRLDAFLLHAGRRDVDLISSRDREPPPPPQR
jgi:hypothetical protein